MTFNELEEAVKLFSQRHVATIYAHNADAFVQVMIGVMNVAVYARSTQPANANSGNVFATSLMGIPIYSQPFLLPGTALFIDQLGQIMQVCRYEKAASESETDADESETDAEEGGAK